MGKKYHQLVAPIIITLVIVLYYLVFTLICLSDYSLSIWYKLLFGVIPFGAIGVSIYVLIERINEIKRGENDDLSKY